MIRSFISVNKEIDIDVKSGEFVINSGVEKIVRLFVEPEIIDNQGSVTSGQISIKTAMPYIDDVVDTISSVMEYHGVEGYLDGNTIVIEDAEYLAEDTIDALETAVKGLNTYLK
jgi:hypothetical protein